MSSKRATYLEQAESYASGVESGEIPSCLMVRLAVSRWRQDWKRDDLYFDEKDLNKFCRFTSCLNHFKGRFAGKRIKLEPWQIFVAANVFGWKRNATKLRRYQYADVYVPRKNGKTTFAALIALYMLIFDGESGAEIYSAAVDKDQAKICFDTGKSLIRTNPDIANLVQIYIPSMVYPVNASFFKPLSKDTKNKDGLNPYLAVCDERHAWKTNEIYDVIKTGMGARSQPLIFSISTAGTDTSNPYFQDLKYFRDIMNGTIEDDSHFAILYEPDDGDKWDDENTWKKVNPNYGVSLNPEYMKAACKEAKKKGGTTLAAFCTKNLNMWVDAPKVWIKDDDVAMNNATFGKEKLKGAACYVGIDYASKGDIAAIALFFPEYKVVRYVFVVPQTKIESTGDRVDYRKWVEDGWLTACPGNVIDDDWFLATLMNTVADYDVRAIAYDPWGMWQMKTKFGALTDKLMEYNQSIRYMSVPTKWLEAEVLQHSMNFLDNPIIRWMFGNVVIYTDPNGNIKLDKQRSRNKIDGVVAAVDAIGAYLVKSSDEASKPYADHDLRMISL